MIRRYSRYNHRALTEQEERNIEEKVADKWLSDSIK